MKTNNLFNSFISGLFVVILSLPACSYPPPKVDPALKPLFEQIMTHLFSRCKPYQVNWVYDREVKLVDDISDIKGKANNWIGSCSRGVIHWVIEIDKKFWLSASTHQQYEVMAHEIGHCVLKLGHIEEKNHFMNSYSQHISEQETYKQMDDILVGLCSSKQ